MDEEAVLGAGAGAGAGASTFFSTFLGAGAGAFGFSASFGGGDAFLGFFTSFLALAFLAALFALGTGLFQFLFSNGIMVIK